MVGPEGLLDASLLAQSRTVPQIGTVKSAGEARRAAEEFESFFLAQMFEHMFAGISTDGPLGGGNTESIFRSMMNDEYGKIIGQAGGIGIADAVEREILKLQEIQS